MLLRHTSFTTTAAVALLVLVGLSTGCNSEPATSTDVPSKDTLNSPGQDTTSRRKMLYIKELGIEYPPATAYEMRCVEADHAIYVQHQVTGTQKPFDPRDPALLVSVGALKTAVNEFQCSPSPQGPIKHAVILHHGLLANGQYDAFLQVVCLTYDQTTEEYTYPATDDGYTVDDQGGLVYDANGLSKWNTNGGPGELYQTKTVLKHKPGGAWAPYNGNSDIRSMVFPYELELEDLIKDNNLVDTDLLQLTPYAEASVRNDHGNGNYAEDGYFHGVAWVPVSITLDDILDPQTPFKNKAADLGAPCPVNCPTVKFKFRSIGVKPRNNC